jgi:hypothetical protein
MLRYELFYFRGLSRTIRTLSGTRGASKQKLLKENN